MIPTGILVGIVPAGYAVLIEMEVGKREGLRRSKGEFELQDMAGLGITGAAHHAET